MAPPEVNTEIKKFESCLLDVGGEEEGTPQVHLVDVPPTGKRLRDLETVVKMLVERHNYTQTTSRRLTGLPSMFR